MNIFRSALRIWITVTSVMGFLAGWIMLAHAPKPKQASANTVSTQAVPTVALPPIPSIDDLQLQGPNQFSQQPPVIQIAPHAPSSFFPVLRTGGSG
jgi:hypothetical protein